MAIVSTGDYFRLLRGHKVWFHIQIYRIGVLGLNSEKMFRNKVNIYVKSPLISDGRPTLTESSFRLPTNPIAAPNYPPRILNF